MYSSIITAAALFVALAHAIPTSQQTSLTSVTTTAVSSIPVAAQNNSNSSSSTSLNILSALGALVPAGQSILGDVVNGASTTATAASPTTTKTSFDYDMSVVRDTATMNATIRVVAPKYSIQQASWATF
ncbi:hypothetical protein HK100_008701 [Physocladia obscura]|uniref:Uncharacterized protein n=1 Tax=Physocladia obscura TaxID=109957 RepID=A0AAD5T3T2_9FUNG|nr:hypothetical protein HK100_008701 [Physocladia obscura]